jgi:indole-3-glycerol phosphate synthase
LGFLEEMVRETRVAIARPEYLSGLDAPTTSSGTRSLRRAVTDSGAGGALLAEFKRVSPGSDAPDLPTRSAVDFVRATSPGEVVGYSCVASAPRFLGSPKDVFELVRATTRPVLFKDFVVEEVQLDAAVRAGANAVLLIARLETGGHLTTSLAELADRAHARQLEVLLEFHDRTELRQVADVAADMYGVNVRNLDTLRMEPGVADATIRSADGLRPLLGLSGVQSRADAQRFWAAGVDGILVGSAVARARDPGAFLRSLHRPAPGAAA